MSVLTVHRRRLLRCTSDTTIAAQRLWKGYCSSSHYSLLGVASTATTAQIKAAFRKVVAALHSAFFLCLRHSDRQFLFLMV